MPAQSGIKRIAEMAAPQISTTICRSGFIIEIEGTWASVTFYPYDKDKTYAIVAKCKELGQDLTADVQKFKSPN